MSALRSDAVFGLVDRPRLAPSAHAAGACNLSLEALHGTGLSERRGRGFLSRKSYGCAGSLTQIFHNSRKSLRCGILIVITVPIGAVHLAQVRRHGFEDHVHTLHTVRLSANFCLHLAIMPPFGQRFIDPTLDPGVLVARPFSLLVLQLARSKASR